MTMSDVELEQPMTYPNALLLSPRPAHWRRSHSWPSVGPSSTCPPRSAGAVEPTRVTIKAEGTAIFGFVKSPDAATCADGRIVNVFKITRDGNKKIGSDDACAPDRSETIRVRR
jgi:hypothetical protein